MDEKEKLYQAIQEAEKQHQKNNKVRLLKAFGVHVIVVFVLYYLSSESFFESIVFSVLFSGLNLFVNFVIYSLVFGSSYSEKSYIEFLKREYDKLNQD